MLAIAFAALFTNAVQVTPPEFATAKEPQIAIDQDRHVYVAYGMGDGIFLSISANEGTTFTQPIKVGEPGKLSLGMRRGPRIAAHNGVVTITATYGELGGGKDGDLLAFRSKDGGKTWSKPVAVNDVKSADREGLHAMASAPDGTLACTWLDLRTKGTKLYIAISKDGGASWSPNHLVYASPSGTVCQCCHPSLAFDSKGHIFIMFRNVIEGARDMYLTESTDGGVTFASPTRLGAGTWMLDGCPMDGGALAISGASVETVWRRQSTLYRCPTSAPETEFSPGSQAWIAPGLNGPYYVWSNGLQIFAGASSGNEILLSRNGNDAVVATSPDLSLAVAAWTQDGVRMAKLTP